MQVRLLPTPHKRQGAGSSPCSDSIKFVAMKLEYEDRRFRLYGSLTPEEVLWQNDKDRGLFRRAILRNRMNRFVRKILFFL